MGTTVFQQNSGYLGGALALHNVRLDSSCEGNLLFKKNNGVYSGAMYLDNVEAGSIIPHFNNLYNIKCKVNYNFAGNSARTAGNSNYFASYSWITISVKGCLMINSNMNQSDIRTAAKCMSFQNSTVFPGQTVFLNGTIQDFFGNPSSCLASVLTLCNMRTSCFDWPIYKVISSGPEKYC